MKQFSYRTFITYLVLIIAICSCELSEQSKKGPEVDPQRENTDVDKDISSVVPIDTFHNALAQLISGIDRSYFSNESNLDSTYWTRYHKQVNTAFSKIKETRLDPMQQWMNGVSLDKIADTSLLFYPFSGADFLHAYYLFPEANDYLLLAQEKIGDIPDINSMKSNEVANYLNAVDQSLLDIYKRSYFITKRMKNDTKDGAELNGLLPLFYWFIARTDHEIVDVSDIFVDSASVLKQKKITTESSEGFIEGVKFLFRKKGSEKVKSMTYFSCDISNNGFEKNPEFKQYLSSIRPCNSFVKSASYLMHYKTFNEIKDLTLQKSKSILEDDTGIPYKYFDALQWDINLYGVYVMPVKDFSENRFQEDLSEAYLEEDKYRGELSFSLGYHWGTQAQNQMLYVKK
tara:strand:- start:234 stop:1436 length:1203 start_codon:yes stop_codon:yes gene_type:complete